MFALLKKNVKITKERIPAATQLFTPDWIVRYMVENSLGRLFVNAQCSVGSEQRTEAERIEKEKELAGKMGWKYYLPEAEQTPEVRARLAAARTSQTTDFQVEDLKIIDPCMGSGHILVYAFDVLMQIYEAQGYTQRDAARLIVEKNLCGLDIDRRAYQLACFAVMMKARQYNRRILNGGVRPNLYAIEDSAAMTGGVLDFIANGSQKLRAGLQSVADDLAGAKEYGSIIDVSPVDFDALLARFEEIRAGDYNDLFEAASRQLALNTVLPLVRQAQAMAQKYDVVVTNPPYMGASGMSEKLSGYVKTYYPDSKSDLFAVFIERCGQMTKMNGYQAMITQHAWMFLSSFEKLRTKLLATDIVNMAHLGARAFEEIGGEVVQTTAFICRKSNIENYIATYKRLVDYNSQQAKEDAFLDCPLNTVHYALKSNFSKIPGSPIAYWVSEVFYNTYSFPPVGNTIIPRHGLATSDNNRFLKLWFEIPINHGSLYKKCDFKKKWFPMNKGGAYRKWYGNLDWVINYEHDGKEIKDYAIKLYKCSSRTIQNTQFYFKEAITWSALTSGNLSFRWSDVGAIFGSGAHCAFANDSETLLYGLALLNGKISSAYLEIISPTLNTNVDDIRATPYIEQKKADVIARVRDCIDISKRDWDTYETSWDFKQHTLV